MTKSMYRRVHVDTVQQLQDRADMDKQIRVMRKQGMSLAQIGRYVGLNASSVCRRLGPRDSPRAYDPKDPQDHDNNHRPQSPI